MKAWYKNLVVIGAAAGGLGLCVILAAGVGVGYSWSKDVPLATTAITLTPETELHLGDPVVCKVTVNAPWYRWPLRAAEVTALPNGLQMLDTAFPRLGGIRFGRWSWVYRITLQPVALAPQEGTVASVLFTADRRGKSAVLTIPLPVIDVTPRIELNGEPPHLTLAPEIPYRLPGGRHHWPYWVGIGVLVVVIALILLSVFLRREGAAAVVVEPPWFLASQQLMALEQALPMPAEVFFVRLTDILRSYLEARFHLRAAEQTTPEFMDYLRHHNAFLPRHRDLLRDFLSAADLVKFARADATEVQMREALNKAVRLVGETKPAAGEAVADGICAVSEGEQ